VHGSKDIDSYSEPSKLLEDKLKAAFVQQKGRFKVTSEDVDLNESEVLSDREFRILQQLAELERKVASLEDELQRAKLRNIQLERQLNAAFNREEEERIKREEAARERG